MESIGESSWPAVVRRQSCRATKQRGPTIDNPYQPDRWFHPQSVLEQALSDYVPERDGDTLFRFGNDTQVSATNFLALTEWHLGELERARQLTDWSTHRAAELGHVASVASALFFRTIVAS